MDLPRLDAGKTLRSLRDEMNTVFDRFFERPLGVITGHIVPSVDVGETGSQVVVRADLPGMDLEDIDVSVTKDLLTIRGHKKQERQESGVDFHIIERSSGSFSRSIRLPAAVDEQSVSATYKKGVLEVVLPKREPASEKKIEIQGGD